METFFLYRTHIDKNATLGRLLDPAGNFLCYTLEDLQRDEKIQNETAIDAGLYVVEKTYSNRFKRVLPLIYNQPDKTIIGNKKKFSGVRIHNGNYAHETEGCILVGEGLSGPMVTNSRNALKKLLPLLPDLFYLKIIDLTK